MIWVVAVASLLASAIAGLRWLRVAQREHYLPPSTSRFAIRWWSSSPTNIALFALAVGGVVASLFQPLLGLLVVLAQVGPVGLSLRGRTSPLAWTSRLQRLAVVASVLVVALIGLGAALGSAVLMAAAVFVLPAIVDLALLALRPVEELLGNRWVEKASHRLAQSGARVAAITGSYGKTTTKEYLHHLISPKVRSVASPASFNNRMGLARAINEGLIPGTEVFIAEMGTYGRGEIAELCRWIKPDVSAIVSIGPVHLERFRTEENIVSAKSEILDRARVGVLAVDHRLLASLAAERSSKMPVVTVSGVGAAADVQFDPQGRTLTVDRRRVGVVPDDVFGTNLAVAVGIAQALGIAIDADRFESLPRAEHRQSETVGTGGFTIIDDTFNSNPAGAALGLDRLVAAAPSGRRVVVTPGMVELGHLQESANQEFARNASMVCDDFILIGATNKGPLLRGSESGRASVTVVADREAAVAWVRAHLGQGDAVLYENDLPDHYP